MKARIHIWSMLLAAATALFSSVCLAQPGPPPGGPGGPGGFGGPGGGSMLGLVMRDEVQQELQLVDEQKDKLRTIANDSRDGIRDMIRDAFEKTRDMSDEERRAKFDEIRTKYEADIQKKIEPVLLPHQMERLKQIDLQNKIRFRGTSALTSGDVAQALNLTDDQREKLEKRAAEVQEELQTKIREAQADARKKMIDVLTPEQQAQLQKLMGDNFDMKDQGPGNFRGQFNRGRGRGNNQGDQPASKAGKDAS